ncbi:MAG TPA: hypothetical protein VNT99_01810 [Methylomirabilota bacterium]|nr:hypothetical protein [Methylomirabilota bacterium]
MNAALLAYLVFVASLHAQYSVTKFTIAGGGGLNSTDGVYAASGTIGQHDASGPLSGGSYTLVGGFWALPSAVQTPGALLLSVEQLAGNNVRVYWPLPATGFVLDQATSLVSPPATNAWSQVAFPYQTNATHISVTVPASGNNFYRLRTP